jgi:hypothetical protein
MAESPSSYLKLHAAFQKLLGNSRFPSGQLGATGPHLAIGLPIVDLVHEARQRSVRNMFRTFGTTLDTLEHNTDLAFKVGSHHM